MSVGEFTLEEFLNRFTPDNTSVIVYNCNGEVKPLIVEKKLSEFLNTLNGKNTLTEILKKHPKINKNEVYEFIEYCLNETVICSI